MSVVADPEVYTGQVPATFAERMKERRRLDAVASDLIASSRRVETPAGVFTLVDAKFLDELMDVCHVTGERILAVVDEYHLARVAQVAGLTEKVPPKETFGAPSPAAVRADDVKALRKFKGWTTKEMAAEFGVSQTTINNWQYGYNVARGELRVRLAAMIAEMKAAQAGEGSA